MVKQCEPTADLPLWRIRKAIGAMLRAAAGLPPPFPPHYPPNVIPFPTGRRRRQSSRPKP